MTITVFMAVITAAMLHAAWNAWIKGGSDKTLRMTALVLGHTPLAVIILPFVPSPAGESWPYLAVGIALHVAYQLVLMQSYRVGDLTQVYPIARGTAPLIVAGVSVAFLGVELRPIEILAVMTIGAGIMSISLVRQRDGLRNVNATMLAVLTGCFIAAYSLVDGIGARLSGTALGFFGWLVIGNSIVYVTFMAVAKRRMFRQVLLHEKRIFVIGGGASFAAYALVVWAFTQAPIALVTALRETSIIFALLVGVFFLKEKLDLTKVLATMITLIGVILLRFSKQ